MGKPGMIYGRVQSENLTIPQDCMGVARTGKSVYGAASMVVAAPAIPVILMFKLNETPSVII